jgi:REP element-mobilizing transposase RayT
MYKNLPKFNDNSYAHFITMNTYNNYPYFKDEELCQILIEELEFYSKKYGFALTGYVIMPDHLHLLVWWDTEGKPDLSISRVIQGIKGATARRILDLLKGKGLEQMLQSTHRNANSKPHRQNLKYRLWQPGFYDFNIYSQEKLLEKLNYIHNNPVRAGLVSSPDSL